MCQLESLVISSQELLGKQSKRFMRELDKLVMTDIAIKNLIEENDTLTHELNEIKQKFNQNISSTKNKRSDHLTS